MWSISINRGLDGSLCIQKSLFLSLIKIESGVPRILCVSYIPFCFQQVVSEPRLRLESVLRCRSTNKHTTLVEAKEQPDPESY